MIALLEPEKEGDSRTMTADEKWQAVVAKDPKADGKFYYAVKTPMKFRKGGVGARIRFAVGECSLGSILVAVSEKGVCAISLGDDPGSLVRDLQDQFPRRNSPRSSRTRPGCSSITQCPQSSMTPPVTVSARW
jgi:hypothetical protein